MSGIVIHRSHHAQEYVVVPNSIARDNRLSFRARGLLVMLLSLPPDWHVTTAMLAEDNPEGRDAIRIAMAELREAGYVVLHTDRGEDGRTRRRIEVFDTPRTKAGIPVLGPTSRNSASPQVAPRTGIPVVGNPGVQRSTGPKYSPNPRAGAPAAAAVRRAFPGATDDEIEIIVKTTIAKGARSPEAVLAYEARQGTLRLPCDRGGPDRHSDECRGGDSSRCGMGWCTCRCHTSPAASP